MIRILTILYIALFSCQMAWSGNRGVPFIRNFSAAEYGAHNRNYDVACDDYGTVYIANFEGLLYYDGSTWRKIHTPGVSRVTRLAKGKDGRIWVGGHKVFGYVMPDKLGRLVLHTIVNDQIESALDEVDVIKVTPNRVYVHTVAKKLYYVKGNKALVPVRTIQEQRLMQSFNDSVFNIHIDGSVVSMSDEGGITIREGNLQRTLTDADGLCSNNVSFITYDKKHTLWGATEHGIFAMEIPSIYSHITEKQGLQGDVYSIGNIDNTLFAGTLSGLYTVSAGKLRKIPSINFACWDLVPKGKNALLAATSDGLWLVTPTTCKRLTSASTLTVYYDGGNTYYTGELDGIYKVSVDGKRTLLSKIEKVAHIARVGRMLRLETIYGELWNLEIEGNCRRECIRRAENPLEPKIDVTDELGRRWVTDYEGRGISIATTTKGTDEMVQWIKPLEPLLLNAIYCTKKNSLWVGGDFGLINCDLGMLNKMKKKISKEQLYIRQVTTVGDSVLWGGYGHKDMVPLSQVKGIGLESSMRLLTVSYSTRTTSLFSPFVYRYRINDGKWSKWTEETKQTFNNLPPGEMTLEIQAKDAFGNISETALVEAYVGYPLYLQWWAVLMYFIALLTVVRYAIYYREKKLQKDKEALEEIVNKRTAELSERTSELSTALDDLQRTQADLVRMERTATAGKLTQGLIDRILNPINYINNFAKLTSGLAKDLREDVEDEQDAMSQDNYEDCQDILDMMTNNLQKIEEHGINTTRTLRAMEAMLKNHIGSVRESNMCQLLNQTMNIASEYHKDSITQHGIQMSLELPDTPIMHEVDPVSINNVLLALITNAVYAVVRRHQRDNHEARVTLALKKIGENHIEIRVVDNGIGIEDTIIDKVFDPFFTTKPTSEASGVGLYLAREVIQDHNGTITIKSVKDEYTEILINL